MEICRSTTDLWEAWLRLRVVLQDAAVGSWVQQGGVVVSGRTAGAFWPFSLKQHIDVLHSWREEEQSVQEWYYKPPYKFKSDICSAFSSVLVSTDLLGKIYVSLAAER